MECIIKNFKTCVYNVLYKVCVTIGIYLLCNFEYYEYSTRYLYNLIKNYKNVLAYLL